MFDDWLKYLGDEEVREWEGEDWPLVDEEGGEWEVYAISDIHTDMKENWLWLEKNTASKKCSSKKRCIIIAGDIAANLQTIKESLRLFIQVYDQVFYIPGNHCLWCYEDNPNPMSPDHLQKRSSLRKLVAILQICRDLKVRTTPARLNMNLAICPLYSWYRDKDNTNPSAHEAGFDLACIWPKSFHIHKNYDGTIADFFLALNSRRIHTAPSLPTIKTISFSHFLPRSDLFQGWPGLNKVMSDPKLDSQLRQIHSQLHVCGHSHLNFDLSRQGVRYLQSSLGYPRERGTILPSSLPTRIH